MPSARDMLVTGNTTVTAPENRVFYPALDGIRTFAFTLVFLRHYTHLPWGWGGVNIFFVLSGFLITGILYDTRHDLHRVRNFYVRRTLRIFPLYYSIFVALLLLAPLMHWEWNRYWFAWPLYLGNFLRFLNPTAATLGSPLEHAADGWLIIGRFPRASLLMQHFWSLCIEEQFYLAWPWVVFVVRSRKTLIAICASAVVLAPVARIVLLHNAALHPDKAWLIHQELLYRFTPLQLDSLLLGALVALLWRGERAKRVEHRDLLVRIARVLAPAMLIVAAAYITWRLPHFTLAAFFAYPYPAWEFSLSLCFINIFAAALILCCLRTEGFFASLFGLRPLRWAGRISYGAYVFHDLFHDVYAHLATVLAKHHPLSDSAVVLVTAAIAYPCTFFLAWLSFRFFESPFLNLKERFTVRISVASRQEVA